MKCAHVVVGVGLAVCFAPAARGELSTQRVAVGLDAPIFATFAPGEPNNLYIAERGGAIKVLDLTDGTTTPFFTVPDADVEGEGGLLGLAFHPDYQANGRFFVDVTVDNGDDPGPFDTVVRRYTNDNGAVASPHDVLTIAQPQSNHNGGWIGFNPRAVGDARDYLYIATGDGGGGNDDDDGHTAGVGNGQDVTDNLLGKILRIDVSNDVYSIPDGNPFVGETGDDEIFAYGLRNPFRASFDRETGDLYIGDVGQGQREEIDVITAGTTEAANFGWRLREGDIETPGVGGDEPADYVPPIYDYLRGESFFGPFDEFEGNTVTGGVLYRGPIAQLQGLYLFGDYASDFIWTFDPADPDGTVANISAMLTPDAGAIEDPVAFAEDAAGNVYIVDLNGEVFKIVPEPAASAPLLIAAMFVLSRRR